MNRRRRASSEGFRPTTSRVLNALFSMLGPEGVADLRVLELYAGKGRFGIDALRRGAAEVVFVEISGPRCADLRVALERQGLGERGTVHRADALRVMTRLQGGFDVIFADPPYARQPFDELVSRIEQADLLGRAGVIFFEHHSSVDLGEAIHSMALVNRREYGDSAISVFRRKETASGTGA